MLMTFYQVFFYMVTKYAIFSAAHCFISLVVNWRVGHDPGPGSMPDAEYYFSPIRTRQVLAAFINAPWALFWLNQVHSAEFSLGLG